jgi:ELMO domain-containing protein
MLIQEVKLIIVSFIIWLFYQFNRMTKWVLHKITGLTELERICLNETNSTKRVKRIEKCLCKSNNDYLRVIAKQKCLLTSNELNECLRKIVIVKNINRSNGTNHKFIYLLKDSLIKINSYSNLIDKVEELRRTQFQFQNHEHYQLIMKLWNVLRPNEPMEQKISKKWSQIGFQGSDPSTDFRGMGLLSLINLVYFTTNLSLDTYAKSIYSRSLHPQFGYSFAIVAINITSWVFKWLNDGVLKNILYTESSMINLNEDKLIDKFNFIYSMLYLTLFFFLTLRLLQIYVAIISYSYDLNDMILIYVSLFFSFLILILTTKRYCFYRI